MPEQPVDIIHNGRYALFEEVGSGEFGEVWRARDNVQFAPVAVKLLGKDVDVDEALQETRVLTRLREHDRVITIRNVELGPPAPFIVMDYMPAGSVGQRLDMGVVTMVDAVRWTRDALDGLAYVHSMGIVHRDIKPSNLLLDSEQRVVLSDFGIAEDTVNRLLANAHMYWRHEAPEVDAHGSSFASDIWAVGCTMYRLLTGRYPFETAVQAAAGIFQAPHRLNPQVPMAVTRVVQQALAVDPPERYASAGAMLHALMEPTVRYSWTAMSDVDAIERWEAATPEGVFILRVTERRRRGYDVTVTRDKGKGPRRCVSETCTRESEALRVRRKLLLKLVATGSVA